MPKETPVPPPMYAPSSRRGGRTAGSISPAQPSSAAAKAAAAAKALHRRAQEHHRSRLERQHGRLEHPDQENHHFRSRSNSQPATDERKKGGWGREEDYDVGDDGDSPHRHRRDRGRNGYGDRRPTSASVFRRSQPSDGEYDGRSQNGSGSILKRLTTGNNRHFRIGPSSERGEDSRERYDREWYDERHKQSSQKTERSDRDYRSEPGKYEEEDKKGCSSEPSNKYPPNAGPPPPSHAYPYHPGMPGGYPVPPGPYSHPPYMHHGHPYQPPPNPPDSSDDRSKTSGTPSAGPPTVHRPHDTDSGESQQQQHPYYPPHPPHHPYAPHPYYEGYYDPNYTYPYGHHHYPPGYYPPPSNPATPTEYPEGENSERSKDKDRSRSRSRPPAETRPQSSRTHNTPPPIHTNSDAENRTSSRNSDERRPDERGDHTPRAPSRSTRRIIGSHTPIHVPRAGSPPPHSQPSHYKDNHEDQFKSESRAKLRPPVTKGDDPSIDDTQPLPFKQAGDPGSVFRSSSGSDKSRRRDDERDNIIGERKASDKRSAENDEKTARSILLSLSKSYDRDEAETSKSKSKDRESTKANNNGEERPKSPDEPPRIQHFHKRQSSDNFEPQPSPIRPSHNNEAETSIEMAPSFTLFNQSFDMNLESVLGPNASFGLGTMKSLSFGLGLGASIDYGDNLRSSPMSGIHRQNSNFLRASPTRALADPLGDHTGAEAPSEESDTAKRRSSATGNIQVLHASPSNSFGNVLRANSEGMDGNPRTSVMVLGDAARVTTPPVMNIKRERSPSPDFTERKKRDTRGDYKDEKIQRPYLRNNARQLPFRKKSSERPSSQDRNGSKSEDIKVKKQEKSSGYSRSGGRNKQSSKPQHVDPSLFGIIERHVTVFNTFSFLLPGAKLILKAGRTNFPLTDREREVARHRINSALCAFGGGATKIPQEHESKPKKSHAKQRYEESLAERYYENESRLSWEIEEDPPVEVSAGEEDEHEHRGHGPDEIPSGRIKGGYRMHNESLAESPTKRDICLPSNATPKSRDIKLNRSSSYGSCGENIDGNEDDEKLKLKYRCKLCGKPKHNHKCLFHASLQRSIGIMVYPAVNAFTANEPGIITPALSEMNNFVEINVSPDSTPARTLDTPFSKQPHEGQIKGSLDDNYPPSKSGPPIISPDSVRPGAPNSPNSTPDTRTPQRWTPGSSGKTSSVNYAGGAWISHHQSPRQKMTPGKNNESPSTDLLFLDALELRPEQYRIVSRRKRKPLDPLYVYPTLPLPYDQRKRISNAMFAMSKSVPGLTDECALVLREARQKDAWDFAVAQLMTQVIVLTHCSLEDSKLDGLSNYLLTLGIAC